MNKKSVITTAVTTIVTTAVTTIATTIATTAVTTIVTTRSQQTEHNPKSKHRAQQFRAALVRNTSVNNVKPEPS